MKQSQREALIDLLLLAIYTDSHLSLSEEEALNQAIDQQGWDSEFPRDLYLQRATAAARAAAESGDAINDYIRQRAALFTSAPAQAQAYSIIHQVLSPDGLASTEQSFLSRLNKAFPAAFI